MSDRKKENELSIQIAREAWLTEFLPIKPIPLEVIFPDLAKTASIKVQPSAKLKSQINSAADNKLKLKSTQSRSIHVSAADNKVKVNSRRTTQSRFLHESGSSQSKTVKAQKNINLEGSSRTVPNARKSLFTTKQKKLTYPVRSSRRSIETKRTPEEKKRKSESVGSTDSEFIELENKCTIELQVQDSIANIEQILKQNQTAFIEFQRINDENMLKIKNILISLKTQNLDCKDAMSSLKMKENVMPSSSGDESMDLRKNILKKKLENACCMQTPRTLKAIEMNNITTQIVQQQNCILQDTPRLKK